MTFYLLPVFFVDSPATMTATFFEVPRNKSPSSFRCCKCAANKADFFCAPRSLQCPVEVVPLRWNCYIRKKRYVWKVVKGKTKMTSLDEIGIAVISPAIVGIGITTARITRGLFWSSNIQNYVCSLRNYPIYRSI